MAKWYNPQKYMANPEKRLSMQTRQQSQIWVGKAAPKLEGTVVHLEENEPTNYTLGGVEEKKKNFGTTFNPLESKTRAC